MAEAVIVEAVRAPVGKRNGGLSGVHPAELSAQVLNGLAQRAGIDPEIVDDVIWGCVMQAGEQALDIARTAVLTAGWPESVPGVTVDRQCGSSQQSVHFAAAGVVAGHYDVVVAGGVESMSRTPMGASLASGGNPYAANFKSRYDRTPNQGIGAEMMATKWGLTRTMLDQFSLDSHEKAGKAQDSGAFDDQIVGIKDADGNVVLKDEGIRRGTTLEKMGQLKPAFSEDGVIHAGPVPDLKYPMLWENKALGDKSWSDAVKKGIKVSKAEMKRLDITGDPFHPEWNYSIKPRQSSKS